MVGWMWLIVALLKGGPRWGARRRVVEGVAVLRAAKWGGAAVVVARSVTGGGELAARQRVVEGAAVHGVRGCKGGRL